MEGIKLISQKIKVITTNLLYIFAKVHDSYLIGLNLIK
jgi:hypothetical protein